jgi:chromosome segregation ATPase
LQETFRVSREVLTGQIAASLQNQQALQNDVRDLSDKADKLTANIGDVSSEQTALHAAVRTNQDAVVAAMTGLADHQEALRSGIEKLDGKADRAAGDIASLTTQQQSLYGAVKANQDSAVAKLGEVAATTGQTARDVTALSDGQAALQQSIQAGNAALTTRATELAETQQALKNRIDTLGQATQQVASDVAKVTTGQDALHQSLKTYSDKTDQQAASLASIQEQVQTNLDTLTATAGQTGLDIIAMMTRQDVIQAALHGHEETLGARTAQLADTQHQMQSSLDTVTATTGQAALDIIGMTKWHDAIRAALQNQNETLGSQMTQLASNQQQMQSSLDTVTATAGQTGLDILGVTKRQDAIQTTLQSQNETWGARMAQLTDNQQQMQNSLDTVTATTGQASLDTISLNNGQDRLGQAVQAGRQEMADKLADVAQGQQKWSERLDAAQAKVVTLGDSVTTLEQRIARLQELLQASIQSTTAALGTTSQQRLQFEAKVSQDMQAVIDSLAQLRQTQTSLQEQIAQVQKSTQGQADSLRSVIQQMKRSPNANDRTGDAVPDVEDTIGASQAKPAPADVQVSHAAEVSPAPEAPQAAE